MIAAIAPLMPECLWNDEYLIGPRIFCFAAGRVAAYVDVSPFRIEGTKDVSGLARHRFSRWKHGFGGRGSDRRGRGAGSHTIAFARKVTSREGAARTTPTKAPDA
jgi:hypothetical protein